MTTHPVPSAADDRAPLSRNARPRPPVGEHRLSGATAVRAVAEASGRRPARAAADRTIEPPLPHPAIEAARLRRLIEAQSVINSDLSLNDMLTRIVRTAGELVGARFGALGVVGPAGTLAEFIHYGVGAETAALMDGMQLFRRGPLGVLTEAPGPVRIDDFATDPRTAALPPFEPRIGSLLGVPIRVRGEVFGDMLLANTEPGSFTADDEELVTALAVTAGTAIANARLYEDAKRTRDWAQASAEITHTLLAEDDIDVLLSVVSRALEAAEADTGLLVLPDADGTLRTTVAVGVGAEKLADYTFRPDQSPMSRLMARGTRFVRPTIHGLARAEYDNADNFGPIMMTPLADARGLRGSVLLIRTVDRPPFTAADLDLLTAFGDQVTVALGLNDARIDGERLRVLEVRHRIAQDLHDNVIQRLFATGMGLHSLAEAGLPQPAQGRLERYVGDLDDTIDEIRERVFGLRDEAAGCPLAEPRFPRIDPSRPSPAGRTAPRPRP